MGGRVAHGRTIADGEHRARRCRRNAGEPVLCDILPGVALARAASAILVTSLPQELCTIRCSTCSGLPFVSAIKPAPVYLNRSVCGSCAGAATR